LYAGSGIRWAVAYLGAIIFRGLRQLSAHISDQMEAGPSARQQEFEGGVFFLSKKMNDVACFLSRFIYRPVQIVR
jgi:hypothetical protein